MSDPQYPGAPAPKKKNNTLTCCLVSFGVFVVLGILGTGGSVWGLYHIGKKELERKAAIPGYTAFEAADDSLDSSSAASASGNNDLARQIATAFYSEYKDAYTREFSGVATSSRLNGPDFATYCRLSPTHCAIVINVPESWGNLTEAQQKDAENGAWETANGAIHQILGGTDRQLAVALRGDIGYKKGLFGMVSENGKDGISLTTNMGIEEALYPYFADTVLEEATTTTEPDTTAPSETGATTSPMSTGPVISN